MRAAFPVAVCRGPEQLAGLVRSHVAAALDRLFPAPDAPRASTAARPAGWEPAAGAGLWPAEYAAREVRVAAVVTAGADGREALTLTVADSGVGMPAEVAARVFEPFFTTRRGRGGSGLGMHIVHQLVHERFGGRVELATARGEGTRWTLTLPMPTEALARADADWRSNESAVDTGSAIPTPPEMQ